MYAGVSHFSLRGLFAVIVFPVLVLSLQADEPVDQNQSFHSPVSAEESLRHFQLHPDLKIELVAAEPQVIDPVAIRFDEEGRMWAVEMIDYPNGPASSRPPMSRIRILEDRDNDGRYETSKIFADKLLFVTGLQTWKGGVIVTLAGKVAYMKDTDGDGRADIDETWFTGFAERNPQLRANHPTFALNNKIYIANGLRGGDVITRKEEWSDNAEPVSISGMDFLFDPLTGKYEAVSGNGQFGLTFDDFGNRFVCSNRNPCKQIVLEDRYIKRNPHLAVRSVFHDVSPAGADSRVFPISRIWTTSTLHEGQFTAACGVTIYRGIALPAEFQGNSFTCEPTGNLVHRDVLSQEGATFTSRSGRKGIAFLATKDEWFRPVNLANGPDGALYVVDMYRAVIEHPQWVPDELKNRPDERDGDDKGRVYRIVAKRSVNTVDAKLSLPPLKGESKQLALPPFTRGGSRGGSFASLESSRLVELLEHSNAWHRETAARLIYERQDKTVRDKLADIVRNGSSPQSRVHAMWALNGLGSLNAEILQQALADPQPRVAEQAVILSEQFLKVDQTILDRVRKLGEQSDSRLRFQVALSLGEADAEQQTEIIERIAGIAFRSASDSWTRAAAASSVSADPVRFLKECFRLVEINSAWNAAGTAELIAEAAEMIGSRRKAEEIRPSLFPVVGISGLPTRGEFEDLPAEIALTEGLGRGLNRRGRSLQSYVAELPQDLQREIAARFSKAVRVAVDPDQNRALRLKAISVLRHADYDLAGQSLMKLSEDGSNRTLQLAAIDTLSKFKEQEIGKVLLADFSSQTPEVRRAILDALLADENRTILLLDEFQAGRIAVSELDPGRTNRLSRHRNQEIRSRAKELLAAAVPEDRKKVLAMYQPALSLEADPKMGQLVFQKNCAACHRIGEIGVNVAPDIADSRTKTPSYLLTAILDPNRAVDNNYFSYTVVTTEGKVITGVISAETATSVTLRQEENKSVTILRQDIDEIRSNGVSLMPVGLEKNIKPQQMADLISFIKNWRYLDGRIPIEVGQE